MANIKVTIEYPISDGTKLKFRTPCESTEVEGLVVKYPINDGIGSALKTFRFVDAHGTELSGVGNVFTSDVIIEVLLDVTKGRAFIKNADTNSYIEDIKVTVKRMDEERKTIFAEAGKIVEDCNEAIKGVNKAIEDVDNLTEDITNKSIYELAVKNGFEGTEAEWLESLKVKGDKGDTGVVEVSSIDDINEEGIFRTNNELVISSKELWNTDITVPFFFKGSVDNNPLNDITFNQTETFIDLESNIAIMGIPLLKYHNYLGNHEGGTYVFVDYSNTSLLIYYNEDTSNILKYQGGVDLISGETINLNSVMLGTSTYGMGEDVWGNWALIKQYFMSIIIEEFITKEYVDKSIENIDIPEVDLTGYATEEYVDKAIENIDVPEVDLTGYAKETYVDDAIAAIPKVDLTGYATEEYVDNAIAGIDIPTVDLTNYATKDDVKDAIDAIDIPTVDLEDYATKEYVNDAVEGMGEVFSNAFKVKKKGEAVIIDDMSPEETIIDAKLSSKNMFYGEVRGHSGIYIEGKGVLYDLGIDAGTTVTFSCDKREDGNYPTFAYFDYNQEVINYWEINQEYGDNRIYRTFTVEKDVNYICPYYLVQNPSQNYQLEVGSVPTSFTPFVDFEQMENVKLEQYKKNLLPYPYVDTNKTANGLEFMDYGDGSIYIKGTATADTHFILSYHNYFGDERINAIGKPSTNGQYTMSKRLFYTGLSNGYLPVSIVIQKDTTIDERVYPQVEFGTVATPYTSYEPPIIHDVWSDGTVRGLTNPNNMYPIMTIKADTRGVLVEAEYNQDINKNGGNNGLSAYEVAVKNGFKGSETDWLESLKGDAGYTPEKGKDYFTSEEVAQIVQQTKDEMMATIASYPVEVGKSGIWTYKKYSDGTAECWGIKPVSAKVNLPVGQMFASVEMFSETFPLTFAEIPMVNVTAGATPYMSLIVTAGITDAQTTTTNTGAYKILRATTTGDNPCNYLLNYDVKGYWK